MVLLLEAHGSGRQQVYRGNHIGREIYKPSLVTPPPGHMANMWLVTCISRSPDLAHQISEHNPTLTLEYVSRCSFKHDGSTAAVKYEFWEIADKVIRLTRSVSLSIQSIGRHDGHALWCQHVSFSTIKLLLFRISAPCRAAMHWLSVSVDLGSGMLTIMFCRFVFALSNLYCSPCFHQINPLMCCVSCI